MLRLKLNPPRSIAKEMGLSFLRREGAGAYLCKPIYFQALLGVLEKTGYKVTTDIRRSHPLGVPVKLAVELRPYQEQAFLRWSKNGARGVVVMPTGAGKTFVALKAIAEMKQSTLIVVPTIDLLNQWHRNISSHLGLSELQVGIWGGGQRHLRDITVMTYDSASLHASRICDRFSLLVFDEVHHLPAETFRRIAEESTAPMRLGLTATPERVDGLETDLEYLVGKVVFSISKEELERKSYVASFRQERVLVDLSPMERMEYERLWATYKKHLRAVMAKTRSRRLNPIQVLVRRIRFDENARIALDAWRRARRIALEALEKMEMLDFKDRRLGSLSIGQMQRVFIARALATEPRLLLLDEPTASIDKPMQTNIYELLQRLKDEVTIILVSHDIGVISTYVDKIACLNRKLFYHDSKEITVEMLEETYQCPVEMIAHGVPHRVLKEH